MKNLVYSFAWLVVGVAIGAALGYAARPRSIPARPQRPDTQAARAAAPKTFWAPTTAATGRWLH